MGRRYPKIPKFEDVDYTVDYMQVTFDYYDDLLGGLLKYHGFDGIASAAWEINLLYKKWKNTGDDKYMKEIVAATHVCDYYLGGLN